MPPKPNKGEAGKGGKDSKKDGKGEAGSVEDRINLHQLVELKAAFDRADVDGGGSLDMDEFLEAFGEVLGKNLTHEQLTHLFMKIDANSDGSVDWDEFTNYMLLETQAASDMSDRSYQVRYQDAFDKNLGPVWVDPNPKSLHHSKMIGGMLAIPKQEKFVTHSRDGTVRVWHAGTLVHQKTLQVSTSQVTDCKHFPQTNRLVASSIDRTVTFYDAASPNYEVTGQLKGLETSPMCIGYWQDLEMETEKMILGDDQGNIALYDVHGGDKLQTEPGSACTYKLYSQPRHADWVTQCDFYPELNFMVSSSLDGTIKIGDLERPSRHCRQLGEVATSTATTPYTYPLHLPWLHSPWLHSLVALLTVAVRLLGGQAWHEQGHLLLRVVQPLQSARASSAASSHACYGHPDCVLHLPWRYTHFGYAYSSGARQLRARARHFHLEPVHPRRQADGAVGGPHLLCAARDDQRGELPAHLVRSLQDDEGVGHAQLQVPADHPGQGAPQCGHSMYRPSRTRCATVRP